MSSTLLDELRVHMYHPRFSSDGERGRRIASSFLGRELRHGQLDTLSEDEASSLLDHLKGRLLDNAKTAIRKAVEHFSNRR